MQQNTAANGSTQWSHAGSLTANVQYFIPMKKTNTINGQLCAVVFSGEIETLCMFIQPDFIINDRRGMDEK